ncbi:MAG TPA: polymer-forming cytoskeletal protein [Chitinophagales bacterium]|nr:polymer-forming cytoskeletal protein [Chitinophagales bacterium]HND82553.1 polymer-forming cytoskeletal protein [Chitinophagales bacterium]
MFSKIAPKSNLETMVANKINDGTIINGNIVAQTDLRIDGKVAGDIQCAAKVVIGATAQVAGQIKCNDLTVEGKVKGNLDINGTLYFRSTAMYEGDVKYKKLIVEEGATINGSLVNVTSVAKPVQQVEKNGQTNANIQQQVG